MKKRDLNFELLRIISMLIIVLFHYSDWGRLIYLPDGTINKTLGILLNFGSKLGIMIFVLISGYYLVNSKFKINKIFKLVLEVLFYSIVLYIVSLVLNINTFKLEDLYQNIFPVLFNQYWFITVYIGLYILFPFINKFIKSLKQETYKLLLIILTIILFVLPVLTLTVPIYSNEMIMFIYLYMLAGYIRLYDLKLVKKNYMYLVIAFSSWIISSIIVLIGLYVIKRTDAYMLLINYVKSVSSLPCLISAFSMFMYFKNISIKDCKIISAISSSTFAVYLIHINESIRKYLFNNVLKVSYYGITTSPIPFALFVGGTSILIFVICIVIDKIRIYLFEKPFFKYVSINAKVDDVLNSI